MPYGPEAGGERIPKQVFTLVYRGNNPYLNQIAEGLRGLGHTVAVKKIIISAFNEDSPAETIRDSVGKTEGKIITDRTLFKVMKELSPDAEVVNAYDLLEKEGGGKIESTDEILAMVSPVVEEIKHNDRQPVVLTVPLGDHIGTFMSDSFREQQGEKEVYSEFWNEWLASLIAENLNIPSISKEEFNLVREDGDYSASRNLEEILEERGFDKDKVVLLVDHHIYKLEHHEISKAGLSDIEITPICSCCIGLNGHAVGVLIQNGFKVYEPKTSSAIKAPLTKLVG